MKQIKKHLSLVLSLVFIIMLPSYYCEEDYSYYDDDMITVSNNYYTVKVRNMSDHEVWVYVAGKKKSSDDESKDQLFSPVVDRVVPGYHYYQYQISRGTSSESEFLDEITIAIAGSEMELRKWLEDNDGSRLLKLYTYDKTEIANRLLKIFYF